MEIIDLLTSDRISDNVANIIGNINQTLDKYGYPVIFLYGDDIRWINLHNYTEEDGLPDDIANDAFAEILDNFVEASYSVNRILAINNSPYRIVGLSDDEYVDKVCGILPQEGDIQGNYETIKTAVDAEFNTNNRYWMDRIRTFFDSKNIPLSSTGEFAMSPQFTDGFVLEYLNSVLLPIIEIEMGEGSRIDEFNRWFLVSGTDLFATLYWVDRTPVIDLVRSC